MQINSNHENNFPIQDGNLSNFKSDAHFAEDFAIDFSLASLEKIQTLL